MAGVRIGPTQGVEARIDQNYLDRTGEHFRVLSYRSLSPVFEGSSLYLRLQFVERVWEMISLTSHTHANTTKILL